MSDAMDLAEKIAERDGDLLEGVIDTAPVSSVRIDMADGSWLDLVSNRLGTHETVSVTCATMTGRRWELEDPDAALVWRVHPAGSDERSRLMGAE